MSAQTDTIRKSDVLARVEEERRMWDRLLAEVGVDGMSEPGFAGDWTMKDVTAHLNAWRRRTLQRLDSFRRNAKADPPEWPAAFGDTDDDDEKVQKINKWLYENDKDRPLADILAESRKQFDEMRESLESLSEEALNAPARESWQDGKTIAQSVIDGSFFSHFHEEHEPAIREKLAASR